MRMFVMVAAALVFIGPGIFAQSASPALPVNLPDGKTLSSSTNAITTNSMPATLAVSRDGRYVVSLNGGFGTPETGLRQSLTVLDTATDRVTDFPDSRLGEKSKQTYFLGLAFSADGTHLYASIASITDAEGKKRDDTGNGIAVYRFDAGKIEPERFIKIPLQPLGNGKNAAKIIDKMPPGKLISFPAGLAVILRTAHQHEQLLVAENFSDDALLLDSVTGASLKRFDLSTSKVVPGSFPYTAIASPDGKRGYVSLWNASRIAVLDLVGGKVIAMIDVERPRTASASGSHPTAMVLSPNGRDLYVALANRDEVAVIDTQTNKVRQRLFTRLPGQTYLGGSPVALALGGDGHLYAANAGSNSVAVFKQRGKDSATMKLQGFIPTEWYPMALALRAGELIIASGKGRGVGPNNSNVPDKKAKKPFPYILSLVHGSLARIKLPLEQTALATMTEQAVAENHLDRKPARLFSSGASPIKHVIYIIKENRSYDQVFGDLANANGDPSLVMYGEAVTPNEHKLAREFGILDNFYDSGEVSGDGHNWSTSAAGSDYLEKTIPISYWGKERNYDYEGEVNNRIPLDDDMPDVNETGSGYIWSNVAAHHLTYRHYGEFVLTKWCNEKASEASPMEGTPWGVAARCPQKTIKKGESVPTNLDLESGAVSPWPWAVPIIATNTPTKRELRGHFDIKFPDFNLDYPDQWRVDEFLREFKRFVSDRGKGTARELPNYVLLRLGNDHTSGTKAGKAAPAAAVSDNDLAVGRVVDAVSHSPYWGDTAILILEDDAQDGPDHVDAHRSIALLVSKYSPASSNKQLVDSQFYCTVDMIRTLEVLLGLPPMNSNDAHAIPIASVFAGKGDHAPFSADYRNLQNGNLYKANPPKGPGAAESAKMDFTHADRVDTAKLNAILWRAAKGDTPMPAIRHADTDVKQNLP